MDEAGAVAQTLLKSRPNSALTSNTIAHRRLIDFYRSHANEVYLSMRKGRKIQSPKSPLAGG